jgi:arabinogalactan endo-1,4-beta-galactosidase
MKVCIYFLIGLLAVGCNSGQITPDPLPGNTGIYYSDTQFVMGVDLSYVNAIQAQGAQYLDSIGKIANPYTLFKSGGANVVRVRKWHTPSWQINLYGAIKYHEKGDVAQTIKVANAEGLKTMLDLHYSDNWADPSKQQVPEKWKNLNIETLQDSIYNYTFSYLKFLQTQASVPDYIQIGNETNGGLCYPLGKITNGNYKNFCLLLQSGCKAVRDFSMQSKLKPKIIIHVAQFQNVKSWIEGIKSTSVAVDYDLLGISHYYKWSDVKTMNGVTQEIRNAKSLSGKEVIIVETAFPWTASGKDNYPNILSTNDLPQGYDASPKSQNQYLQDLTQAIIDGGGKGIVYWEPAWISSSLKDQWGQGSSWENATFFDYSNKWMPSIKYMRHPYKF